MKISDWFQWSEWISRRTIPSPICISIDGWKGANRFRKRQCPQRPWARRRREQLRRGSQQSLRRGRTTFRSHLMRFSLLLWSSTSVSFGSFAYCRFLLFVPKLRKRPKVQINIDNTKLRMRLWMRNEKALKTFAEVSSPLKPEAGKRHALSIRAN